jgi:FkbM family methyltransferase
MDEATMNGNGFDRLQQLLDEQTGLLHHETISSCANRQGLRERSGSLLEAAFLDLATGLAPTLSVEIGAHEASFSERLKTRLPALHALAFEANPFVYRQHAERLSRQAVSIDYRHAAICREDGTVRLEIPVTQNGIPIDHNNMISSLLRRMSAEFEYESVLVPALSLDTALKPFAVDASVAWIDAEGAQSEILAGGRGYFEQVTALYIEIERKTVWCDQKLGGEITERLADFSLVPIMRDNLAKSQYNEIYVRSQDDIIDTALPSILTYIGELRRLVGVSGCG